MTHEHGPGRRSKRVRAGNKSPAYQWYPRDAVSDGAMLALTNEQEGLYRRFLDHAWLEDGLPDAPAQLFAWAKCNSRAKFDQLWMTIEPFFPVSPDGRRRNRRQEQERAKQRKNSRVKQLAAKTRWGKEQNRRTADAHARASTPAVHVECLALAPALAPADLSSRAEEPRTLDVPRARPVRMELSIWEVRSHILAAVHALVESGAPYVDADGQPAVGAITEEIKTIASRNLGATWKGRELQSIVDAALGRRAALIEADLARRSFERRERRMLAKNIRQIRRLG